MMPKHLSQRNHFKNRFHLRFGRELTTADVKKYISYIKGGKRLYLDGTKCEFIKKQSTRVALYRLTLEKECFIIAFDKIRGEAITCLFEEDEYERRQNENTNNQYDTLQN